MSILFINANLHGHINPTLGLVKNLTERGNKVNYFCSAPFSEQVTMMGAKWIGYSNKLDLFLKEYHPTDRHPFFMLMEYILLYVNEALYFGVPMLALPQVNDQHMVAKRLVSLHLGETESIKELTSEVLRSKTETLLNNKEIKENCMQFSREMRDYAQPLQTVQKLEDYIGARKERR